MIMAEYDEKKLRKQTKQPSYVLFLVTPKVSPLQQTASQKADPEQKDPTQGWAS